MRGPGTPAEPTNMAESREVCCSSPAAMCYWFATSLIAWGVLGVAGVYWSPLHWYSASTILLAAGIGCIANWLRNRFLRSEEHTSELQSRGHLVCRLLLEKKKKNKKKRVNT